MTTTLERFTAFRLSNEADCASPDAVDSPGAELLLGVQDSLAEMLEDEPVEDWESIAEDGIHEVADGAPSVYTYERWKEFTDLGAWTEDPSELGGEGSDMEQLAGICLYIIAERLCRRLVELWTEAAEEDEDDDAEEATCQHCGRTIVKNDEGVWIDPEAPATPEDGDDFVWRETCDAHDTFTAEHEPTEGDA